MNLIKNISKSEVHVLKDQVTYQEGQVVSKTLAQNNALSVTLFAFDKGEEISTHESGGDAFVTCLDGVGRITIDGKDYEKIKESVFLYGGVQTSIYNGLRSSQSKSPYYNQKTNSYCYIGTEKPNHDVVIIGWDDSYSKENFNVDLEGDGAFICQNSWGDTFGEDGVFYISYYDTNIGTHNVVYTKIEDPGNYDHIYQSDLCGWVGQLGYNKDSAYGANVYTTSQEEELVAAGFYATGKDSQYELYVVRNFENADSLTQRIPVASGKLSNAGYYTIDFNQAISLDAGERYAIVLHMITPGSVHPMAIEYAADEATANVILDDGESYISTNGARWDSVDTVEECNLCIKAFSKNR